MPSIFICVTIKLTASARIFSIQQLFDKWKLSLHAITNRCSLFRLWDLCECFFSYMLNILHLKWVFMHALKKKKSEKILIKYIFRYINSHKSSNCKHDRAQPFTIHNKNGKIISSNSVSNCAVNCINLCCMTVCNSGVLMIKTAAFSISFLRTSFAARTMYTRILWIKCRATKFVYALKPIFSIKLP